MTDSLDASSLLEPLNPIFVDFDEPAETPAEELPAELDLAAPVSNERLAALLAQAGRGDEAAFSEVYRACRPWMLQTALRVLRSRELAEETVQEAMLKVWQRAGSYHADRGTAKAWLMTVVRNHALDVVRLRRPVELACDSYEPFLGDSDNAVEDPAASVDVSAAMVHVLRAMDSLPEHMKKSVLMSCCEGYTHSEIAEHMQAPLGTVKAWVRRGLKRLRNETRSGACPQFACA